MFKHMSGYGPMQYAKKTWEQTINSKYFRLSLLWNDTSYKGHLFWKIVLNIERPLYLAYIFLLLNLGR